MKDVKHVGFIAPEITPDQYIFGAGNVGLAVIQEDGNWGPLLPIEESQNKGKFETYNCTAFGTTNAIELLLYKLTGERHNYSDRWVGIISGTKAPGNDPHKVAEAIRKYGLIPEEMLPFSDDLQTVEEYYSFKGANEEACYRAGREWLAKYDFKHEWTFTPGQPIVEQVQNMKVALKGSPQCVAVYAWASTQNNIYYKNGPENHWTTVYNIDDYMKVFDSYSPYKKNVEHTLQFCKRYSITKKNELTPDQVSYFQKILNWIAEQLGLIQKKVDALPKVDNSVEVKPQEVYNEVKESMKLEKLYDVSKSLLGKRLTLDKSVPINVGCAQAVSYVLKEAGYKIPKGGISGTYTLYEWLQKNFTQIDTPERGCVVISPTTVEIGHVGICGELNKMYPNDYAVMSNDSITGKYDTQWRLENWKRHYKKLGTFYFKP